MKKFFEVVKDILYDSVDYIIMIGIVGIVIFIIGWRLDLLFAKDALDIPPKDIVVENNNNDENIDKSIDANQSSDENQDKPEKNNVHMVKITIPSGSVSSKIGSILEENGLVNSQSDFVLKAEELMLDTKLKSGSYEIKSNSTLEEILTILTK